MTFEEAYEAMANGEPLQAILMLAVDGTANININAFVIFLGVTTGTPCIVIEQEMLEITLFWTADGISVNPPPMDE